MNDVGPRDEGSNGCARTPLFIDRGVNDVWSRDEGCVGVNDTSEGTRDVNDVGPRDGGCTGAGLVCVIEKSQGRDAVDVSLRER